MKLKRILISQRSVPNLYKKKILIIINYLMVINQNIYLIYFDKNLLNISYETNLFNY